jgi:hypothetical protein
MGIIKSATCCEEDFILGVCEFDGKGSLHHAPCARLQFFSQSETKKLISAIC